MKEECKKGEGADYTKRESERGGGGGRKKEFEGEIAKEGR